MPENTNEQLELSPLTKWLAGLLLSGAMAWATWVTTDSQSHTGTLAVMGERLARIEAKLDILLEKR